MKALWLAIVLITMGRTAACEPDPCAELVRHCCGDNGECGDGTACQSAQRMRLDGVYYACAEALDAPLSYPACRDK